MLHFLLSSVGLVHLLWLSLFPGSWWLNTTCIMKLYSRDTQLMSFTDVSSAPPSGCVYEQQPYRHTEHFYHPTDNCRSCACTNGTVHCQRKPCPFAPCSHPITQQCCRTCEGTVYYLCQDIVTQSILYILIITLCHQYQQNKCDAVVQSHKKPHFLWFNHVFCVWLPLQAADTRAESERMGRLGMMHLINVQCVSAVRAQSGARGSTARRPTVNIQSRDSAACPVKVSETLLSNVPVTHFCQQL